MSDTNWITDRPPTVDQVPPGQWAAITRNGKSECASGNYIRNCWGDTITAWQHIPKPYVPKPPEVVFSVGERVRHETFGHGVISHIADIGVVHVDLDTNRCVVANVRDLTKPKYRPFANAAEFEPHRDRWVTEDGSKFRVSFYNDNSCGCWGYDQAFEHWTFDDGTPFGVQVDESEVSNV